MESRQSEYVTKKGTVWLLTAAERGGKTNIVARVIGKQKAPEAPVKAGKRPNPSEPSMG